MNQSKRGPVRVSIIGGGFGGLALGIRLQAAGFQVTILEKDEQVGGRASQFREHGYTFDMGPTLITAPKIIDRVFQRANTSLHEMVDLVKLDPFYRVYFSDGTSIDYTGNDRAMREQMANFNREDADHYSAFMDAARPIYETVIEDELGARPFDRIGTLLSFLPRAVQLGAYKSTARFAGEYFDDFRHQFLFSFHPLFIGGHPFRAPAVYSMIPYLEKEQGVWFAKGGMYRLIEALASAFTRLGGTIQTDAEVTGIETVDGRVRGVHLRGERLNSDLVVSNADAVHTYRKLLDGDIRAPMSRLRTGAADYSMSCFLLYLGVRIKLPKLAHHTIVLGPRYRELLDDIFDHKVLPADYSMYIHVPTKTDPSMAPPDSESMYVLVPVPNLGGSTDWDHEAHRFGDQVIARLEDWGLHDLSENVDVRRSFTPLDFKSRYNAHQGHAFGIEPRLTQTAYFRPANRSPNVEGLYLVGADTHPGAGLPGVLLSAEATEHAIHADLARQ